MQLSFEKPYRSILAFPNIAIPPSTVVIGLNGSGKSHLLQAISNGSVSNSVASAEPDPTDGTKQNIKLLSQESSTLNIGQAYESQGTNDASSVMFRMSFEKIRLELLAEQRAALEVASSHKITEILQADEDVWRLGAAEVTSRLGLADIDRIADIFAAAEQALTTDIRIDHRISQVYSGNEHAQMQSIVQQAAKKLGISPLQVSVQQVRLFAPWDKTDPFATNLPLLFGRYRDALLQNRLLRINDEECGAKDALTEQEFIKCLGRAPWDEFNETLAAFSLPYEFAPPSLFNFDPVTVKIKKIGTDHIISPGSLSSGEKVLLQFALSSFNYDEHFRSVSRPKVLLLDEMDASFHPEMVNRWLGAVQRGLVKAQGVNCILTTHSPTTVALAPEAALFEMRDGRAGLSKVSKQEALNRLTFGVPTLSINYTGRRQVFAESDTDAAIYERVYAIIKSHIQCTRELNFLSTGLRSKDGVEFNSGSAIVKRAVSELAKLGNSLIFGIIDWDGNAVSTDRIKVLASGERNGIENVLLDPLLVALLLMKERCLPDVLHDIQRFSGAQILGPDELQRLIDAIQTKVFPDATERVKVSYLGGASAYVLRVYLEADDHELEAALVEKFPVLNKWKRGGRGKLVKAVVEHVISEHMDFCPLALPAVFEAIANAPT